MCFTGSFSSTYLVIYMKRLFLDESGDCSFSPKTRCNHFVMAILSVDDSHLYKVKNRLKRKFARFIRNGWDKTIEPKAFNLNRNSKFGNAAVSSVIETLVTIPSLKINYIVVNKAGITNQSFRQSPYGTVYNYFTGILLSEIMFLDGLTDVHLIYDQRNKESHKNRHFDEYVKTKIYGTALEKNVNVNFHIEAGESSSVYGLLAVDYFSWAIFRKFEYNDCRFFDLFKSRLGRRREWYL